MTESLIIDRRFRGIGRLKKATGTADPDMHALYVSMCEHFAAAGAVEWLEALKRGTARGGIAFAEAYRHFKPTAGRALDITRLPSPETVQALWRLELDTEVGALRRWRDGLDCSPTHRANIARDLRWLARLAARTRPAATVADVPALVTQARKDAVKRGTRRSFNMLRDVCRAFLRDTVGVRHALYFAVVDIKPLDEQRKATSGLPVGGASGVRAVMAALTEGSSRKGAEVARAWWLLCTTGLRPAELWQEGGASWTPLVDGATGAAYLHVYSSKTRTWRKVPVVDPTACATPLAVSRAHVRIRLWELQAGEGAYAARGPWPVPVSPYTGRRTFRHACDEVGIPDIRAKNYRSVAPRTTDEKYKQHDPAPYLAADAVKLRAWFGVDEAPPAGLTLHLRGVA